MNQRLEKYLLERQKELRAVDTKDNLSIMSTIHGALMEIDLIFANFGYSKKTMEKQRSKLKERNMINLYVDDLRDCPSGFVVARTCQEAIRLLEEQEVDILSLDHDLGEDAQGNLLPTGYDLVKYICEKGLRANKIYIHTDNPVGRANMYETLQGAQRRGFIADDIEIYHYPITENKYTE